MLRARFLHSIQMHVLCAVGGNTWLTVPKKQITHAVCLRVPDYMVLQQYVIWCGTHFKRGTCTTFCATLCDLQPIHLQPIHLLPNPTLENSQESHWNVVRIPLKFSCEPALMLYCTFTVQIKVGEHFYCQFIRRVSLNLCNLQSSSILNNVKHLSITILLPCTKIVAYTIYRFSESFLILDVQRFCRKHIILFL